MAFLLARSLSSAQLATVPQPARKVLDQLHPAHDQPPARLDLPGQVADEPTSARRAKMATADSLRARKDQIVAQFHEHADLVRDVQRQAIAEVLPALRDEEGFDEAAIAAGEALLRDRGACSPPPGPILHGAADLSPGSRAQ